MREQRVGFAIVILQISIIIFGLGSGCGHHKVQMAAPKPNEQTPISFLKNGQTTKGDVFSRFGGSRTLEDSRTIVFSDDEGAVKIEAMLQSGAVPIRELENGRILVVSLDKKYRIAKSADRTRFHLILVFTGTDGQTLERHGLVRIQ